MDSFQQAQVDVKTLTKRPGNDEMLQLYALFKQGTVGDVTGSRPGMLKMVERAKFDAWAAHKGKSQADAQTAYVALVKQLQSKYA